MLFIGDFFTDNSDDLDINGDISLEPDGSLSAIKTAERRVTGRMDDFPLSSVGAGLEQFLLHRYGDHLKTLISSEIRRALTTNFLFASAEFKITYLNQNRDGSLPILVSFSSPYLSTNYSFKTLVNLQDQRSYN